MELGALREQSAAEAAVRAPQTPPCFARASRVRAVLSSRAWPRHVRSTQYVQYVHAVRNAVATHTHLHMPRHNSVHAAWPPPPQARVALEGAKTALAKQLAEAQRLCAAAGEECARVRKRNEQARAAQHVFFWGGGHARCTRGACMGMDMCMCMGMGMGMGMCNVHGATCTRGDGAGGASTAPLGGAAARGGGGATQGHRHGPGELDPNPNPSPNLVSSTISGSLPCRVSREACSNVHSSGVRAGYALHVAPHSTHTPHVHTGHISMCV